ncbi:hypothetical protein [Hwanghaeella sp.]|uniref:hypothetical protein n=1 Tax=Hwanghaeella sp. TaxID=2605943 RepID=UPI003CCC2985
MKTRAEQFARLVVRPALKTLDLWSPAAERLVLGTALVESNLDYIEQIGGGPALGFFQMEPDTANDIWRNYLAYRPDLLAKVMVLSVSDIDRTAQLAGNAYFGAALCRVHYFRVPAALPAVNDSAGLAAYWKQHYNTAKGAGTPAKFLQALERFDA